MLVPNQLIEVRINNKNREHFQKNCYDVSCGDTIIVPPSHLPNGSHSSVKVVCDICQKIIDKPYKKYIVQHTYNMDCCRECNKIKYKMTILDKYGVDNVFKSIEIKEKIKQTMLDKYGYEHVTQVPIIKEKIQKTFQMNNTTKTSSQQKRIYEIIKNKYENVVLNHPYNPFYLDVFLCENNVKIDIEYDSWYFHQDKQRDIKRDKFLQSKGFKTLRIRSGHLLPQEQDLFDAIECLLNTNDHFKELILDDWKEKEEEECREQLQVVP